MGKKRVISKTDTLPQEESQPKVTKSKIAKKLSSGNVYISSSYNNTFITITDKQGDALAWASAGALGFKGPKKATSYASSQTVKAVLDKVRSMGLRDIAIFVKGIGSGREAAIRAFASQGLSITSIKDITPIPHNGCRPPKPRRV